MFATSIPQSINPLSNGIVVVPIIRVGFDDGAAEVKSMKDARVELLNPGSDGGGVGSSEVDPGLFDVDGCKYCENNPGRG